MNLVLVYEKLKYTGKGVRIAIIDDGIEYTHDDLKDNYVSISFIVRLITRWTAIRTYVCPNERLYSVNRLVDWRAV